MFFGVHKDAETLRQILDPATFAGMVISDDAAVYANFTQSQKCWAHFLRKAIKLTLMKPSNAEYRRFADRLLEIYRAACRVQRDRRLNMEGRKAKVAALDDAILELCAPMWAAELPPGEGPEDDYRRLCNELMRVMLAQQLFTLSRPSPWRNPTAKRWWRRERTTKPNGHSALQRRLGTRAAPTRQYHRAINRVIAELDERSRRLFAGIVARQHGHGGVQLVAEITGLSRVTICRGLRESERGQAESVDRVRRPGGGRKRVEKKRLVCGSSR